MKYLLLLFFTTSSSAFAQVQTPAPVTIKDTIVKYKEKTPQFPGGGKGLYEFIHDNLQYPPEAVEKKIQGTVVLHFTVNADGSISNISALQGVGGGCTEEGIRIVKAMPKWTPGLNDDGTPVSGRFNLPIVFQLPNDTMPSTKGENANQLPKFPGGDDALRDFIVKNLKYPGEATENNISGTVVLKFIISATGDISNIEVVQGMGGGCTEEAIRVVKAMPKWVPAKKDGKEVQVYYKLPIGFQLQN